MKKEEIYAMTLFNYLVNTSDHPSKIIRRSWGGAVGNVTSPRYIERGSPYLCERDEKRIITCCNTSHVGLSFSLR